MQKRICQNSKSTIAISVDPRTIITISVDLKSTMTIRVDLKSIMTIRAEIKSTKTISVNIKSFHTQHRSTTVFLYPILVDHGLFIIRRLNWGKHSRRKHEASVSLKISLNDALEYTALENSAFSKLVSGKDRTEKLKLSFVELKVFLH